MNPSGHVCWLYIKMSKNWFKIMIRSPREFFFPTIWTKVLDITIAPHSQ